MNYVMDYRLIYCLRNGLPLDMDVYDAAEWSCITELSEKSVIEWKHTGRDTGFRLGEHGKQDE